MRNLRPIYILLGGSSLIGLFVLISLYLLSFFIDFPGWLIIALPLFTASISFVIFFFFIRRFISERLKILYRSIRKGKFEGTNPTSFSMMEDVIQQAANDTNAWSKEKTDEISRLKEQEEFRREFLGNLAHELKTPVFSIQGYILTLLDGGLEDENVNRTFLERASKATERMTSILEDLDQITGMEVNEIVLQLSNFDIKSLVEEVFEELEMQAQEKDITLRFSKEFDPIMVNADRGKIAQVLTNLIRNSISYGSEGGETSVRFYIMDDIITIEVSDNGLGIAEQDLPRLFERFYRVEKSRNRHEGGSGLGLAIAKHIIEAHGQTINVRSTQGVGSTFTFSLDKKKR